MANTFFFLMWILLTCMVYISAYVTSDGFTGKLPTLGWNSWNAYNCEINEEHFLGAAQALIDTGLKDAGYNYVNIDDCWIMKDSRDEDGHLVPNTTRFPDGINSLAEKVHGLDLKFGIYSSAGNWTCAGHPASLGFEETDASDFASWGVDYLKYDNCNVPDAWKDEYMFCQPDTWEMETSDNGTCRKDDNVKLAPNGYNWSTSKTAERFSRMRDAIHSQSHEILLSICVWGFADVAWWGNDTGVNWRISGDIFPGWDNILRITNINSFKMHHTNFWGHNDADMLEIGNGLALTESRSHFTLWAAIKSPLLIGTNITNLTNSDLRILKNKYLLKFNQDDVYGEPAMPYKWGKNPDWTFNASWPAQYWSGQSKKGTLVLMFNPGDEAVDMVAVSNEVPGLGGPRRAVNIWTGDRYECATSWAAYVSPRDTVALMIGEECRLGGREVWRSEAGAHEVRISSVNWKQ